MYELFDHTADLGLRVRADELETLFAEAARGLFSMIVEDPTTVRAREEVMVRIEGDDPAYLLIDWLAELLRLFDTHRMLLGEFDVRLEGSGLAATVRGEPLDPARHALDHEVEAITYHGLRLDQTPDGWQAEVIVDI